MLWKLNFLRYNFFCTTEKSVETNFFGNVLLSTSQIRPVLPRPWEKYRFSGISIYN